MISSSRSLSVRLGCASATCVLHQGVPLTRCFPSRQQLEWWQLWSFHTLMIAPNRDATVSAGMSPDQSWYVQGVPSGTGQIPSAVRAP